MSDDFDAQTVTRLRDEPEVVIRTEAHPDTAVPIWIVVSGNDVFVRSVRGPKGRWYRDLAAGSTATLEVKGHRIGVRAVPATDGDFDRAGEQGICVEIPDEPLCRIHGA